jgi:hypothetical protein
MIKDMINNPVNTAGMLAGIALENKIEKMAKKHIAKNGAKSAKKVSAKIVTKAAKDLLRKAGLMGGKLGKEMLEEAAEKAGKKFLQKVGTQAVQKGAASAVFGPGAAIVGPALMAFSIVSIGLDIMDVGGFSKTQTLDNFNDIKVGTEKAAMDAAKEYGSVYPSIVGPLDKIDPDLINKEVQAKIDAILKDTTNPIMAPMMDAILKALANNELSEADLENEATMDKYMKLIDMDLMYINAHASVYTGMCKKYSGIIVKDSANELQCSYATKQSCDSHYAWNNNGTDSPIREDDIYSEWLPYKNTHYAGDACVGTSFAVRQTCENMGRMKNTPLNYIPGGTCQLTEQYCSLMGQSNKPNPKYGNALDCYITNAQKFLQGMLGDTVTKGLAAVFFENGYIYNEVENLYKSFVPQGVRDNKLVKEVTSRLTPMMFVPGYAQYKQVEALIDAAKNPGATIENIKEKGEKLANAVSETAQLAAKAAKEAAEKIEREAREALEAAARLAREAKEKIEREVREAAEWAARQAREAKELAEATARVAREAAEKLEREAREAAEWAARQAREAKEAAEATARAAADWAARQAREAKERAEAAARSVVNVASAPIKTLGRWFH